MKKLPAWAAAVALGAAVATTSSAFGQADLQLRQAAQNEKQQKEQNRDQNKADRQERRQEKKEREQLNNMPQGARKVLKAETENATNIDYYRHKEEADGKGNDNKRVFGATFTKADGHQYDIKVDRDGNVLSRTDLTAQQTAAARPATPAPATPATPAPATPAPTTPAPAPTSPSASAGSQDAPESGSPVYRRLQANEVPANIKTVLDREAQGGKDVKYYRSKYGQQMAYTVRFDDANGREQAVHVADNGTVLARGGHGIDETNGAQTASGNQPAKGSGSSSSANAAPGRVELNAIPRQAQTQLRRLTEGASDVKFYRTKYGNEQAYQANYTSKDGKEHRVFVDDEGKILSQRDEGSGSNAKSNSK
jgi:hypothetical protein